MLLMDPCNGTDSLSVVNESEHQCYNDTENDDNGFDTFYYYKVSYTNRQIII